MESRTFRTHSEEETIALGGQLAGEFEDSVVLLIGQLGAGKTTLAKGIVGARNGTRPEEVSSPTFTLIHQYGSNETGPVFHVDLYRLDQAREVERLGLEELFGSGHLVLMEWAERFPALLPKKRTEVRLRTLADDAREISVSRVG